MKSAFIFLAWTLSVVALFFALLEVSLQFLLSFPPRSATLLAPMQRFYLAQDRRILQYQPQCYDYDDSLTYRLKTGQCPFSNREFSTKIQSNSQGLRATEDDLTAPSIIVTGDSFAFGWGVQDQQAFPELLKKNTGKAVLNVSSPSFGTARELRLVERQNLSSLKWLIIQYCSNDITENVEFDPASRSLKIMPRAEYERIRDEHIQAIKYYPGKYLLTLFPPLARSFALHTLSTPPAEPSAQQQMPDAANHAKLFLDILAGSRAIEGSPQIIVLHLDVLSMKSDVFIRALELAKNDSKYPKVVKNLVTLDLSEKLDSADYFRLDDHINPRGHEVVARELKHLILSSSHK